jgi:hypothetical protein
MDITGKLQVLSGFRNKFITCAMAAPRFCQRDRTGQILPGGKSKVRVECDDAVTVI